MRPGHLSEDAIQQYVLDASSCETDIIEHSGSCEICKTRIANYRSLFAAIREQPRPAFEFDVAALVLSQLEGRTKELPRREWPLYLLISAALSLLAVPLYILRKDIIIMFAGILPITISLVTISTILVFSFQGIELLKKYKWRSDALNY
jgi:hypothetical protein